MRFSLYLTKMEPTFYVDFIAKSVSERYIQNCAHQAEKQPKNNL